MLKWRIKRTVDLMDAALKTERLKALATMSSRFAHELRIRVQEDKKDADLTGFKVALSLILPDKSSLSEVVTDAAKDSYAIMTLPNICYEQAGEVKGVLHLTDDSGGMLPLYAFVLLVGADMTDILRDPDDVVPSVAELLAQIQTMRTVTQEAQTATQNASVAASAANEQAKAAKDAADAADAAAKKLSGVGVEVTMLDSGSAPGGSVTQTDSSTTFHLRIPVGPTGPKGDTGATPEITVEVTTGEAGSEATASVSGTAENPVIHLTIPRGDTGRIDGLNYYEGAPAAPSSEAFAGSSDAVARGDHAHPLQTEVSGNAGTATKLETARKIGDASFDGSADITLKQIGAYPAAGIRVLEVSLPAILWPDSEPYEMALQVEGVTEMTDCRFEFGSTQAYIAADIDWETAVGTITLSTTAKPTGDLAGRVILMEVSS